VDWDSELFYPGILSRKISLIGFVAIETSIALIGGISVIAMFFSFVYTKYHFLVQILFTLAVGTISGLEIPVLSRLLNLSEKFWLSLSGKNINTVSQEKEGDLLKNLISNVLSFDYLGGLAASLLFSSILLPWLGLVRLNFLTGILNLVMALICMLIFWKRLKQGPLQLLVWFFASVVLISGAVFSKEIYDFSESRLYSDQIIYSEQTPYQRVVVTKRANDLRLYLNGGVQFSTLDEYRYHESLVVPGFLQLLSNQEVQEDSLQVVFFGGGDGLAVREALKFEKYIKKIQVVDIDPAVTNLAKSELFAAYNHSSLLHEKVEVINQDVWLWIQEQSHQNFDLIVSDLPDPQEEVIARLYTKEFYKFCRLSMKEGAVFISQSSGIYNTPKVFWSVHKTLQEVFFEVVP
jgi:spermidine synthase